MSKHRSAFATRRIPAGTARSCLLSGALVVGLTTAGHAAPPNVDSHLARLADAAASAPKVQNFVQPLAQQGIRDQRTVPGRFNAQGHVLVHVNLDGTQRPDAVQSALTSLGVPVIARKDDYAKGIMAAWLPKEKIAAVAGLAGVRSLTLEHRPQARVGKVTSQGATVLRTNLVNNLAIKGDGITVGVLSDSFNTAKLNEKNPPVTTAEDDVKSGDLPVVNVLEDYTGDPTAPGGTDEGRAMCQIVYDLAPHSALAFATAFVSEVDFANNIIKLRTQAGASVIVDDITYFDDPVFSDGLLSQAVEAVSTSTALPGKKVIYASSAGNDGDNGYRSVYRGLSDASVRKAGSHGNLKLDVKDPKASHYLDPKLTAGGWHNWNDNPGPAEPVTTVNVPDAPGFPYAIFLQWDDLFDQTHGVTTGLNFLVFDADGNYLPALSSTSDAFSTQQPFQGVGYLIGGTSYQIAITKTTKSDKLAPPPAVTHLALYTTLDGAGELAGKHFRAFPLNVPDIYGHPAAESAIAVAAYEYDYRGQKPYRPVIEYYTSPGPAFLYFDANYQRVTAPIVRLKPEVAGVDGVATTFFGGPYFNSPYSFFGTSAAAPHVAAVAALVLQAAGGPGSLDAATVKGVLEATTPPRDVDPLASSALGASSSGFISVTSQGTPFDTTNFITISYFGSGKNSIDSITFDGAPAGITFDTAATNPAPTVGTTVGIKPTDVTFVSNVGTDQTKLTLKFKPGTFVPGAQLSFTVDQDALIGGVGGNSSDELGFGTTFVANLSGKTADTIKGTFQNSVGAGYNPADGFGLVDALGAVELASTLNPASQKKAVRATPVPGPVKVSAAVAAH